MRPFKVNLDEFLSMHSSGQSDAAMAKHFKCSRQRIHQLRVRNGLTANHVPNDYSERNNAIREFNDLGLVDTKIAEILNLSPITISYHRRGLGIASVPATQKRLRDKVAYGLYLKGESDTQIAQEIGTGHMAVYHWRQKNGLPANYRGRRHLTPKG